ncbi:MAG TPA: hypothetical protein VFP84_24305 [Kofleriaceae bacterium]|nr:hypothetical protein [Kofleriaceae bacterium]
MAAVLVHIDLDGERPHPSSLQALAAGRAVASSWGATLYAAMIAHAPAQASSTWPAGRATPRMPGSAKTIEAIRIALVRGGADKIVVALTDVPVAPLWSALGAAWQGVLDHLRPRLVLFGADAPAACELGPRTGARIGARLFTRARPASAGPSELELRDRDGAYVRMTDGGAAVVMIGAAPRIDVGSDDDIDVMVLELPGGADARIELMGSAPADPAHAAATLIALGDDAAADPEIVRAAGQLAQVIGAHVVTGAQVARGAPLTPELCIAVGAPAIDLAGTTSVVKIGGTGGRGVDGALSGPIAAQLGELAHALEGR